MMATWQDYFIRKESRGEKKKLRRLENWKRKNNNNQRMKVLNGDLVQWTKVLAIEKNKSKERSKKRNLIWREVQMVEKNERRKKNKTKSSISKEKYGREGKILKK